LFYYFKLKESLAAVLPFYLLVLEHSIVA